KKEIYPESHIQSLLSLSIAPSSGEGGCAPKPKNDNPLADKTAVAIYKLACTIIGDKIFGNICLNIIRISLAPNAFIASIYSKFLTSKVELRTIRANVGIAEMATAYTTLMMFAPNILIKAKAIKIPGKANKISIILITIAS